MSINIFIKFLVALKINLTTILRIYFRGQCYKTFVSVIYKFLNYARVLVRLDWKSLSEKNTLAYYENLLIAENVL